MEYSPQEMLESLPKELILEFVLEHFTNTQILDKLDEGTVKDYALLMMSADDHLEQLELADCLNYYDWRDVIAYYDRGDVYDAIDGWDYTRDYLTDAIYEYALDGRSIGDDYTVEDVVRYFGVSDIVHLALELDTSKVFSAIRSNASDENIIAMLEEQWSWLPEAFILSSLKPAEIL